MKLRANPSVNLTQPPTSKHEVVHPSEKSRLDIYQHYEHPWYKFNKDQDKQAKLIKPNPPTKEAVERAKFVDKTYHWSGSDNIRSGGERTTK